MPHKSYIVVRIAWRLERLLWFWASTKTCVLTPRQSRRRSPRLYIKIRATNPGSIPSLPSISFPIFALQICGRGKEVVGGKWEPVISGLIHKIRNVFSPGLIDLNWTHSWADNWSKLKPSLWSLNFKHQVNTFWRGSFLGGNTVIWSYGV